MLRGRFAFGALSLLLAAGLVLAACRPAASPTPTPRPATPTPAAATPTPAAKPEGELRVAWNTLQREMLDPIRTSIVDKYVVRLLYDYLVGIDELGNFVPEQSVAYKWESSPDGMVWTFYIRQGIKFHNGDELTNEDVSFTLQRAMGPVSLASVKPALLKVVGSVAAEPPDKVLVRLKTPDPAFLTLVSEGYGMEAMILPKKYIEANGDEYFAEHPVGSGAYKLKDRVFGSYIRYEALDDSHWRVGVPKYKYITYFKVPEESTRIAMLKRGEADIIDISIKSIKELEAVGFEVRSNEGARIVGFYWQRAYEPDNPVRDVRVRQALSLAINRQEIINYIFMGRAEPSASFLAGSWAMGYKPPPADPYDPTRAKDLLAEAGYPGGKGLEMTIYASPCGMHPEWKEHVEAVAGYWNDIGVKTTILTSDYPVLRKMWVDHTTAYPSVIVCGVANRSAGHLVLYGDLHSSSAFYQFRFPEWDAVLDRLISTKSLKEFEARMEETLRFLKDNYITLPLLEGDAVYAVNPKKVAPWNLGRSPYDFSLHNLFRQK